jgi:hypothetical protein
MYFLKLVDLYETQYVVLNMSIRNYIHFSNFKKAKVHFFRNHLKEK